MVLVVSGSENGMSVGRMLGRALRGVLLLAAANAALLVGSRDAAAQSEIVGWGTSVFNSTWNQEAFVEVAAGRTHSLARFSDGSVVAWGRNDAGQCDVPVLPPGLTYIEVAGGVVHSLARRSDGSVLAWGSNSDGQCDVPVPPPGLICVEVAAAHSYSLARYGTATCAWYCGAGTNMDTYTVGTGFVLGGTFQGSVGISAPNIGAVVAGYLGQLTFPIWGQQGLVNFATPEVMGLPSGIGTSPVTITWPVPNEPAYTGFHVFTQAAGFGGGVINLTCAFDCTVGY